MDGRIKKLEELKRKRNAVILAHNYQRPEIQDVADFIGDSLALSMRAKEVEADVIVFCGVNFMAESAKILNPDKVVLHPDADSRCPMAAMVNAEELLSFKKEKGMDVVSYVNTTADVKAVSDICCTSANAVKVVKSMDSDVIFVPDSNLGKYVKRFVTDRDVILWPGFCPTHDDISGEDMVKMKEAHPEAKVVVHPECRPEVIDMADSVASTGGMVRYAMESDAREFIIATEKEMCYRLKKEMPNKEFYCMETAICPNMKKITLDKVINALEKMGPEILIDNDIIEKARKPLERMMEIGR